MENALVIVESPAKARTIEKYLGAGYRVTASTGHLRDLPKSTIGVDIAADFTPDYEPIASKSEIIGRLQKEARSADRVFLATDPDREGEAISWHLKELLELPEEKTARVTFNEITKKVVLESIQKPRKIDMDLVDAQQARRILDRIVGYKLSPLLWSKIRRGLSAGRVQSAVTRMVVDREQEIRAFEPKEYWLLDAELRPEGQRAEFTARFYGTEKKKLELPDRASVDKVINAVKGSPFTVGSVKRQDKSRSPAAPFITSTLQQEASRRLNMTPRRTMSIAQQLYEGVNVTGEGSIGLITYMRTDSLRISAEAIAAAKDHIIRNYGSEYYPPKTRYFKTSKEAQDAHEAIRPSDVELTPERIRKDLTEDQYRLYRLIWRRFMASQMANAVYDAVSVDAVSAGYVFKASTSSLKFPGFTKVYDSQAEEGEEKSTPLPHLNQGDPLELLQLKEEQKFTQPPARYTEDTLIRAMEEKGIGRPSTYAPTVSTILDREYVLKEGKFLKPTSLGETVTGFMEERFGDIVDLEFTAHMEATLDEVEKGNKAWKQVLREFYGDFAHSLEEAEVNLKGVRIKVPDEVTSEICPNCGRNLVVKTSRFGRFLGCPGYPECKFTKPIVIEMPGRCPQCGARILKRSSKRGYTYYACERGTECGFMTWDVPLKDDCPSCGKTLFKRSGRGYRKPFCINPECSAFVPEDQRGYRKKTEDTGAAAGEGETAAKTGNGKTAEKKSAAGAKTAAKKTAGKKTAARKTTSKTTAAKKSASAGRSRKPAAKGSEDA
ncbi:MAG: type I DNA topoisomerase [Oscillospiraceae bacterium]|nr:type I DNA topoisomerase [Oscillospiraceae bacterium]